jgi:hypothetical protein
MNRKNIFKFPVFILNLLKNLSAILQQIQDERRRKNCHEYYKLFLLMILISFCNTRCLIVESNTVETVLDHISSPDTLVIFDIDNTLAHPAGELSSDEWFCYLVDQKIAEGHDYITAIYYALPAAYYAQFNIGLEPIEFFVPFLLKQLIKHNIATMALTTRSLFVSERTLEELEDINIQFLLPNISQDNLVLHMPYPCFYSQSILFTGNNDKGQALLCFLQLMNYFPKKIIFIDDKMKYLLSVEKALEPYDISFVGIRYSGCDERVGQFNAKNAESQWRKLRYKHD